ncbi:hypothetical protein T09_13462 [Trichinella sp. T9]|nr:hypothetical protein T09_13462 [Trichinella sp. T9]
MSNSTQVVMLSLLPALPNSILESSMELNRIESNRIVSTNRSTACQTPQRQKLCPLIVPIDTYFLDDANCRFGFIFKLYLLFPLNKHNQRETN